MPDLLIELFSEEIPARMQAKAAQDLQRLVTDGLVEAGLTYAGAVAHATPRRLTLAVEGLTTESPTTTEERRGPKVGAPDKAVEGFLRSAGLSRDDLTVQADKKGEVYIARLTHPGRPAAAIVAEVLEATIRNFPWPKSMRWGSGTLRWVRPLRRILCILSDEEGAKVVPLEVDGIASGDVTEGHRFMAPGEIKVTNFEDYEGKLKRAHVVLSAEERAEAILQDARNQAFAAGLELVEDTGLLREVAGLVEWPVVLMGEIGADFLDLPPEVLQTSMKEHQKFFSVRDKDGRIVRFITVANIETADHGATILSGNNRVLSARLADAKFFWENDLAIAQGPDGVEPWLDKLANVTFHAKLGSEADRIARIASLAAEIAPMVGADPAMAERAARLAKADLASEMVYEFPDLEGVMGRYYAEAAGESAEVARVAEEHRAPKGPSDDVPTVPLSVAVALADKIELFVGMWAINELPTGSKDPFGLRRSAIGLIRLILERDISVPMNRILSGAFDKRLEAAKEQVRKAGTATKRALAASSVDEDVKAIVDEEIFKLTETAAVRRRGLLSFLHDRLKVHLRDEGIRHDVIDACLTGDRTDDLAAVTARARALNAFLATEDGENLIQGYKRARNILTQAEEADGVEYSYGGDPKLAETDEERALFAALDTATPAAKAALDASDYPAVMAVLAALRAPIDEFFEAVQVNADNPVLRRNRLNLLSTIVTTCESIADLNRISG